MFNIDEMKLLYSLRSRSYPVKQNFEGIHPNKNCRLGCPVFEDQDHVFSLKCPKIKKYFILQQSSGYNYKYDDIFGSLYEQKQAIIFLTKIDKIRNSLIEEDQHLPGGTART